MIYGAGIGVLTYIIRTWGGYPDGVAFAVLLMNLSVPLIDRYTIPRICRPRPLTKRNIAVPTATLAIIAALLTVGLVTFANLTRDRIARNQQVWIKQHLDALVSPQSYDNDPLTDTTEVTAPDMLGTAAPVTAYRMRKAGLPVAVAIRSIAPDGYRGPHGIAGRHCARRPTARRAGHSSQ